MDEKVTGNWKSILNSRVSTCVQGLGDPMETQYQGYISPSIFTE